MYRHDSWREKSYLWLTRVNDQKKERHAQDPDYVSHSSKTYDAIQQPEDYANVKLMLHHPFMRLLDLKIVSGHCFECMRVMVGSLW